MALGLKTPLTELLGIKHPVMLAGMGSVSSHELVAAVSNAGGIGTFGGINLSPDAMRLEIKFCKELLKPGMKFGVDLLIPKIGEGARATNHDYTGGHLAELIDIIIEGGAGLFVCAVGVPPKWAVDKLHAAGIPVMNMVGAPHHVPKALEQGVDIICGQGTEAGGHTGVVATLPLIPQICDLVRGKKNFFGQQIPVVAAGGLFDGRGLAASLAMGATGVWVGTRFIASEEAAASPVQKENAVRSRSIDTYQTIAYSGRPCRVIKNKYADKWESDPEELKRLTDKGIVPFERDLEAGDAPVYAWGNNIMGQAVGGISSIKPAAEIVEMFVSEAVEVLQKSPQMLAKL